MDIFSKISNNHNKTLPYLVVLHFLLAAFSARIHEKWAVWEHNFTPLLSQELRPNNIFCCLSKVHVQK